MNLRERLAKLEEVLLLSGEEPAAPPVDVGLPAADLGVPPAATDFGAPADLGMPPSPGVGVGVGPEEPIKSEPPPIPEDATLEDLIDALNDIVDDLEAIAGGAERLNIVPRDVMAARAYLIKAIDDLKRIAGEDEGEAGESFGDLGDLGSVPPPPEEVPPGGQAVPPPE